MMKYRIKVPRILKPKEDEINRIAYMYLGKQDHRKAFTFFSLNLENYPKSANINVSELSNGLYYIELPDNEALYHEKKLL